MIKEIVFDMDGTIADLYGVENWLRESKKQLDGNEVIYGRRI